jgi:hypothetical protein
MSNPNSQIYIVFDTKMDMVLHYTSSYEEAIKYVKQTPTDLVEFGELKIIALVSDELRKFFPG